MALKGTKIASPIVPTDSDTAVYATHYARFSNGGWQEVTDSTARDFITLERREAGMAVYVTSEQKLYILNDDLETWTLFETGKIDTISVNGEVQPIEDKNVDITVPTKTSDIENDGDGESPFATQDYVDEYGGKIDVIKVNGTEQEIIDKTVDITVPTKTSDIDNDSDFQNSTQVQTAIENNIIDNVVSTDTNKSLSANQGKILQDQINNLLAIGRYLSNWNCTTGLPTTNPQTDEYTYHTGDYFYVNEVATVAGQKNYKPNGIKYIKDVPSTTEETKEVYVGDIYLFDGTNWILLSNTQKTVTFANIAGDPKDNIELASLFNNIDQDISNLESDKLDKTETPSIVYGTDENGSQITYTAGDGIKFEDGKIINTNVSAEWGKITGTLSDQEDLKEELDKKANTDDLADIATSGSYNDASDKPSINGVTLEGNKTQGELDIRTYSPYPDDFVIDDSFEALVDSILNSTGAKQGNAYLGTISGDYMPWGYGGAECKVEYMQDDIAVLTINSADVAPYTWSYNTYSDDYTWKSNILQSKTIPDTSYTENVIIQYIGNTTENYTNGYFYKCINGEWVALEIQKTTPVIWGNIGGEITDQTDLNNALNNKIEYAGQIKEWIDEEPEE